MNRQWLPKGHTWGLHIEHDPTNRGGRLTGGGRKLVWHTTEGLNIRDMQRVLKTKEAEPHFLIGRIGTDREDFTVVQFIPLNQGSRALEHPHGTRETNNANVVQVEICEYAARAGEWRSDLFEALGALLALIDHRITIPHKAPRAFSDTPNRYSQAGFIGTRGHLGHQHVPSQPTNHWDPGRMQINRVFRARTAAQRRYG